MTIANRVVLIKDEPIFTLVIGDLLAAGFDVATAAEASQAWELLHCNPCAYEVIPLVNAVERCNQAISHADTSELLMKGRWRREIPRRLVLPKFKPRYVEVNLDCRVDSLELTI